MSHVLTGPFLDALCARLVSSVYILIFFVTISMSLKHLIVISSGLHPCSYTSEDLKVKVSFCLFVTDDKLRIVNYLVLCSFFNSKAAYIGSTKCQLLQGLALILVSSRYSEGGYVTQLCCISTGRVCFIIEFSFNFVLNLCM